MVDALDLPGHGDWPPTGRPLDLDRLVDGIAGRLGGPVDLLAGHSLGAATAVALAGRRPGTARAVVLEDPPSGPDDQGRLLLAAGVEADARTVRRDRARLVRREREANPAWADEDVEHSVDGIAAADAAAVAGGRARPAPAGPVRGPGRRPLPPPRPARPVAGGGRRVHRRGPGRRLTGPDARSCARRVVRTTGGGATMPDRSPP
jgi:pimeloyl-ACP methyl ester carboxylesterase